MLLAGAVGLAAHLAGRATGPARARVRTRRDRGSPPGRGRAWARVRRRPRSDPTAALAVAVTAVAAELRAGRSPGGAWRAALGVPVGGDGVPDADDVVAAVGGRPGPGGWPAADGFPAVRARPARRPAAGAARVERHVLAVLAATRLATSIGAPLGAVLESSGRTLAADADAETAVRAALAGPQQTVTLLTWLPAAGLGIGTLFGADPLGVLLGGGLGSTAGFAGAGLTVVGRWWVARMVAAARDAGDRASGGGGRGG
nr:hypothetical protein [Cellulomonas hominis]